MMESSSSATSASASRPLTVLSFDGGGLRGLSALFVLKKFMTDMRRCALFHKAPEEVPAILRPCDYFDVIGGTSTGEALISELPLDRTEQLTWTSIFAVMFGSLRMNVDQAIDYYTHHFMFKKRRKSIFGKSRGLWLCDPDAFELQIKAILEEGRRLTIGESKARCVTAVEKCETLIVVTNETNGKPFIFSDFNDKKGLSTAKLSLACHATCAVSNLLPPAKGSNKNGASGAVYSAAQDDLMNPTSVLLSEIDQLNPGRRVGVVVSIGCGAPPSKSLGKADNLLQSVLDAMNCIYKGTRRGTMMAASLADPATNKPQHSYFRWNIGESLTEVGMFEVEELPRVKQLSEAYCQAHNSAIESCVGEVERCSSHEWNDKDPFHENWEQLLRAALQFEYLAVERLITKNEKLYSKSNFRVAQIYAAMFIKALLEHEKLSKQTRGEGSESLQRAVQMTEFVRDRFHKHLWKFDHKEEWSLPANSLIHARSRNLAPLPPLANDIRNAIFPCHEADLEQAKIVLKNYYDGIAKDQDREKSFLEKAVVMDEEARRGLRGLIDAEKLATSAVVLQLLRQHVNSRFPPAAAEMPFDSFDEGSAFTPWTNIQLVPKESSENAILSSNKDTLASPDELLSSNSSLYQNPSAKALGKRPVKTSTSFADSTPAMATLSSLSQPLLQKARGQPLLATANWPDLQTCRLGDSLEFINIINGCGRARKKQLETIMIRFIDDPALLVNTEEGIRQAILLCQECQELKLSGERFFPSPLKHAGALREEQDILLRKNFTAIDGEKFCPLCRLVSSALRSAAAAAVGKQVNWYKMTCTLSMIRFSSYWDHEDGHESFRFLRVGGYVSGSKDPVCEVDMLPAEDNIFPHAFIGRKVNPEYVSPKMIRRWLQQCEILHGDGCRNLEIPGIRWNTSSPRDQTQFKRLLPSLYFIDTLSRCLVKIHANRTSCRYVALSYVWGKVPSLQSCHANIDQLMHPGSLFDASTELSAVVADAMNLVADIGERYLWVDSLCIIQDDEVNKQAAINQMNLIYENALLTIIAAEGTDATTGLPGVRGRPRLQRQLCGKVGAFLDLIVPHSLAALDRSKWASRAWTFQEEFFSPRRLIFTNGQVVFSCGTDTPFREDIVSEYQIFGMEDYVYKLPRPPFLGTAMIRSVGKLSMSNLFANVITRYSRRELSFQSDILNAFAGVSDMTKNDLGDDLCFGILSSALAHELSWRLSGSSALRRLGFPSWSWCGWQGEVVIPLRMEPFDTLDKWTTQCSWIRWYIYDNNSKFRLLPQKKWQKHLSNELGGPFKNLKKTPQDKRTPQLDELYKALQTAESSQSLSNVVPLYFPLLNKHNLNEKTTSPATLTIQELKLSPGTPLTSYTLCFRTLSTTVSASIYAPDGYRLNGSSDYVHLYNTSDEYLGAAQVTDKSWFISSSDVTKNEKSFVPLSARKCPIHMALLSGPSPTDAEAKRNIWGSEQMMWLFVDKGDARNNPRFYQVMLIVPLPGSLVVYERVGMGEIHSNFVERMDGLEFRDILLQ